MLTSFDLQLLAEKIKENIQKEFEFIHLSKNLMDTITVARTTNGYEIEIPAEIYDINKYYKQGVIVYTNEGSYAQEVDDKGGFSTTHKNYIIRAIMNAIEDWKSNYNVNGVGFE
jgi:hypothetical protein